MRIIFLLFCLIAPLFAEASRKPIRIAMVMDGPSQSLENIRDIFQKEIADLMDREQLIEFSDPTQFMGDWSEALISKEVSRALRNPQIDIVVAVGPIASNDIGLRKNLPKPSFAPFIIDHALQGLPFHEGASGVHNLNYLTFPTDVERDIQIFQQLKPFQHLTFLTSGSLSDAIPALKTALKIITNKLGIDLRFVGVANSSKKALAAIPDNTEAIYLLPLLQMSLQETKELIDGINERKIPSFTLSGRTYVEAGVLATMTPDSNLTRLGRRLALNIQRTLFGEEPGNLIVDVPTSEQLILNMETACIIDAVPSWELLLDAEVVKERDIVPKEPIGLLEAVDEALWANASLIAAQNAVASGCEDVNKAFAPLLPQVEVKTFGRIIDKDRAIKSQGWEPQKALYGGASATQVVYSNRLLGGYSIEKSKQLARRDHYDSIYLDTVLDVSISYFNLLRAKTLQDIQLANLRRTRSNLVTARQRVAVGQARSSEVFRWESEVATNRTNAVRAAYNVRSARVNLNQILNRDQACPISVEKVTANDCFWVLNADWFEHNIADSKGLEALSDFSVHEGYRLSPAIHEMKHLICAQATALGVANRAFFAPDVGLSAEVRDRWYEGGKGTNGILSTNGKDWVLAFSVNFPLYTGGARDADKRKAFDDLLRLSCELTALEQKIEEAVRISINNASASYAAIGLSLSSATAAGKNLSLVTDAYSKGAATIIDLLDAQNQALIAELIAANAEYDFLIDLVRLQRAMGRFDFLSNEVERAAIMCRLSEFIEEHRKDYPCVSTP
ncbi:MAG: TolC family protein [Chlamydiales bacterium]|nr:TolC family protein [Chlamydiales bacterium]